MPDEISKRLDRINQKKGNKIHSAMVDDLKDGKGGRRGKGELSRYNHVEQSESKAFHSNEPIYQDVASGGRGHLGRHMMGKPDRADESRTAGVTLLRGDLSALERGTADKGEITGKEEADATANVTPAPLTVAATDAGAGKAVGDCKLEDVQNSVEF